MKLCECGCGSPAPIARMTNRKYGHLKGQPVRFVVGHRLRLTPRKHVKTDTYGYVHRFVGLDRGDAHGYRREHVLVAEAALGKPLPAAACVHHVDGNKANNAPRNLVVCQDNAYHKLLHTRAAALAACGRADYRRCSYCHSWDAPSGMVRNSSHSFAHRACKNEYDRNRRLTLKLRAGDAKWGASA